MHLVGRHLGRHAVRTCQRGEIMRRPAIGLDPVHRAALEHDREALAGRERVEARGRAADRNRAPASSSIIASMVTGSVSTDRLSTTGACSRTARTR